MKQPTSMDHRVCQRDGSYRWTRSSAVPLMRDDSSVIEWIGISYDIHHDFGAADGGAKKVLSGEQIRGARDILNWAVRDLADASGVSPSVLRRLEEFDGISPRMDDPIDAIRSALERAGIEFLDMPDGRPGIRRGQVLKSKSNFIRTV
jgi:hypothetical protein